MSEEEKIRQFLSTFQELEDIINLANRDIAWNHVNFSQKL